MKIILASESKRRKKLLNLLNLNFTVTAANIDESKYLNNTLNPKELCSKLAYLKANKISANNTNKIIIGGDTIVVIDNEILGKPKDQNDAFKMLNKLNNKKHSVITGISIQCKKEGI